MSYGRNISPRDLSPDDAARRLCDRYHSAMHAIKTYSHVDSLPDAMMAWDSSVGVKEAQEAEDAIIRAILEPDVDNVWFQLMRITGGTKKITRALLQQAYQNARLACPKCAMVGHHKMDCSEARK